MYVRSDGTKRLALGDALANFLMHDRYFIEEQVLDRLLHDLNIEELWSLGKNQNSHIRKKAREVIFDILDIIDEKREEEDNKIVIINTDYSKSEAKKKIIKFKRKDEKND